MAIKEPRKFVTTDQGHADVLNIPITTLYENDQALEEAIKNIKVDEATTTVKGTVRLSADYKSTSSTTVPNSKALSDLYTDSLADKGKPFMDDFDFLLGAGRWRIDRSSFTPATDHSPPGAYPKGVLFVASSKVTEGLVVVHTYVDETGGIYNRVRTVAGTWLPWDGLASKNHTHSASDLPSASTQARGIVQLNTSTGSTATDQAATPSAVKTANDRANEAYNLAQQSLTQAVDLKNKIVGAINGKFGGASSDMSSDQIAAAITNAPVKRFARGTFNGQSATAPNATSGASMNVGVNNMSFLPTRVFIRLRMSDTYNNLYIDGYATAAIPTDGDTAIRGRFNNYASISSFTQSSGGFSATLVTSDVRDYAGSKSTAVIEAFQWWAFE
ncbi:phage tail protein [Paenibacillus polymyxa]|uniref:phage tail protein n=1 Tax=Paenibacillus polymyxa TaxID=1406 RepID=UPI0020252F7D|nr:tail fiber protein [Paenibacillus polymyxa]URJ36622.3 phage tail protein [Paenibacillus polymyxa]